MSVILPKGTARGECDCSHRWSRHDLARTDGGGWALACHDCGRPCVALSKGAAEAIAPTDFGRFIDQHPELEVHRMARIDGREVQPEPLAVPRFVFPSDNRSHGFPRVLPEGNTRSRGARAFWLCAAHLGKWVRTVAHGLERLSSELIKPHKYRG